MKHFFSAFIALSIILSFHACDEESTSTEKPITALFQDDVLSDIAEDGANIDDDLYEYGFEFTVTKAGKVTQLGAQLPDDGEPRVILWDMSDTSVLAQKYITLSADVPVFVDLDDPVSLATGKKYAITIWADDYYYRARTDEADYPYPITKGNVAISKYVFAGRPSPIPVVYPAFSATSYIAGLMDFTFETAD